MEGLGEKRTIELKMSEIDYELSFLTLSKGGRYKKNEGV